jgi:hypothetical protein
MPFLLIEVGRGGKWFLGFRHHLTQDMTANAWSGGSDVRIIVAASSSCDFRIRDTGVNLLLTICAQDRAVETRGVPAISISLFLIVHPLGNEQRSWGLLGVRHVWA